MRVLLIHPNFDAPLGVSLGLSFVAAALKRAGHDVGAIHISEHVDYPFELRRVLNDISAFAPDLLGISCGYNHYGEAQAILRAVEEDLHIPVVMGGIHATLNAESVMAENPTLSFLNVGEGESSIVELADALQRGGDVAGIHNIHARVDGEVFVNPPRPFLDLAGLPAMDTSIWDFQHITDLRRGWVNVSAQRGCPYRCTYCHNNGEARLYAAHVGSPSGSNTALGFLRYRPKELVVQELLEVRERYEMQAFSFIDDTFTMNPAWVLDLLALYREEVRVPFVCNTTSVNLSEELIDALAEAGCRLVRMGVESGSDRMRSHLMKRAFPEERIRWAFDAVQRRGMHALAFNMIGNLDETRDETLETFRFNAQLKPTSMKLSLAHPYPGTEYHDEAVRTDAIDPAKSTHNFIESSVLRRQDPDDLWLDKLRVFYFWYVNRELANEGSPAYVPLIHELEALTASQWHDPSVQKSLWDRHYEISARLQAARVLHYTAPFPERPDLTVSGLAVADDHAEIIRREHAEPH